jgi:MFS family permease
MFLPESPRWLIYKDRAEEALAILVKYHGNGNPEDELVQAEYFEIVETLRLEKETRSKGIKLFFETKGNRRRLLILLSVGMFGQWSGNGLVSYYLAKILKSIGITDPSQQNMINGVVTIVNYVTGLTSAYIMGRVKRRYTFVIGGMFMWITFTGLTTCIAVYNEKAFASAGRAALGMIFISNTAYNLCLNPALYLYPSEILPYRLRAMGMSVVVFANKTALMFNQFVNPIGMDSLGWKFYLVYVVWILVEVLFMYFVYPETHGYSLESLAEIFDGPSIDTLAHEAFKRAEAEDKAGAAVESVETKLD